MSNTVRIGNTNIHLSTLFLEDPTFLCSMYSAASQGKITNSGTKVKPLPQLKLTKIL